jgi:hypothetical protein
LSKVIENLLLLVIKYLPLLFSASTSGSRITSCFGLFLKRARVALDVDRRLVMKYSVEDRRGDHPITENLVPLAEAEIRSQDFYQINASRRSFFVIK